MQGVLWEGGEWWGKDRKNSILCVCTDKLSMGKLLNK